MTNFTKNLIFLSIYFILNCGILYAQQTNIEKKNNLLKNSIFETYKRTMKHWDIDYDSMKSNKAGAACFSWDNLKSDFLSTGLFDALGYSRNIPTKRASILSALGGCERMKKIHKLDKECKCITIIANDEIQLEVPMEDIDPLEKFKEGVTAAKSSNYNQAVEIFTDLAIQGDKDAQYNLATLLYGGKGHPQNYNESLKWAWLSYLSGQPKARALIIKIKPILNTENLESVRNETKSIIEKRALKGDINAVAQLARWHIEVLEEPDHEGAYTWYAVAAALNIKGAAKNRDNSRELLESEQIPDLQKKAAGIFSSINKAITLNQEREGES